MATIQHDYWVPQKCISSVTFYPSKQNTDWPQIKVHLNTCLLCEDWYVHTDFEELLAATHGDGLPQYQIPAIQYCH